MKRLLSLVLANCLIVAGCQSSPSVSSPLPPESDLPDQPQVLHILVGYVPQTMTPAAGSAGHFLTWTVYDSVTRFGENYAVRPSVAEAWTVSTDGSTWTIKVRNDMHFPDGVLLDASDVMFSLEQLKTQNWPQRSLLASVISIRQTGQFTLQVTTSTPDMTLPNNLTYAWVLPKRAIEQQGFAAFSAKPFGSGPYEIIDFSPGEELRVAKRNAQHPFRNPIAAELQFQVQQDSSLRDASLQDGIVDMALVQSFTQQEIEGLRRAGLVVKAFPLSTLALAFPSGAAAAQQSPLRDVRVRQALNYAVDNAAISRSFEEALPNGQFAVPGSHYWDAAAKPIPYDPVKAKALLAEAGYPSGFRLATPIEFSPAMIQAEIVSAVQGYLAQVGVEADLTPLEQTANYDKAFGRNGQQKAEIFGTSTSESNGFASGLRTLYGCNSPAGAPPEARYYCNPEWDRLLAEAYVERDPAKQAALLQKANALQRTDVPFLYLFVRQGYAVLSPKMRGVQMHYLRVFNLDSAYKAR